MTSRFSLASHPFLFASLAALFLVTGCASNSVNTSASPQEAAEHFLDAQVEGGYAAAQAYVYPGHREDKFLTANWNFPKPMVAYNNIFVDEAFMGSTTVTFGVEGEDWSADTFVNTAAFDGVWWVVSPTYIVEPSAEDTLE